MRCGLRSVLVIRTGCPNMAEREDHAMFRAGECHEKCSGVFGGLRGETPECRILQSQEDDRRRHEISGSGSVDCKAQGQQTAYSDVWETASWPRCRCSNWHVQ